jgi:hypothetical protein
VRDIAFVRVRGGLQYPKQHNSNEKPFHCFSRTRPAAIKPGPVLMASRV